MMNLFGGIYGKQLEHMMTCVRDEFGREPEKVAAASLSENQIEWMAAGILLADGVPLDMAIWLAGDCKPLLVRLLELAECDDLKPESSCVNPGGKVLS